MDYFSTEDYSSTEDDELSEESKLDISKKVEILEKDREARWNDFMERYSTRDCGSSSDVVDMDNIENFVSRSLCQKSLDCSSLQSSEVEQIDFEANDYLKPSSSKNTRSKNCIVDEISICESQKSECFKLSENMKEEEQIIDLKNFIENVLNIKLEAYFVQLWSSIIKRDGKQSVLRKVFLENIKIVRKKVDDDLIIMYFEKCIQLPDVKKLFHTIEKELQSNLKLYFAMREKNIIIHDVNTIEKEWELLEKQISTKEICWYHAILYGYQGLVMVV
ncbi:uncharacterized protein LOC123314283 isoform X2 [Coccinella septempunctata]|uniref:uncharacterized protein LOC123314283 isoform X2 n=1 Tax=Coccinella septempunctata TaxID=41139 RepID=UPI001D076A0E|nr:uncharacterized protein LOC123314283 isoform X2 [Coccinella septempunctata]